MQYRLISVETEPVILRMYPKTVNGHVSYNHFTKLEPGKIYETDDPAQMTYLREHKEKARYRAELETLLKDAGIPYEIIKCRSCGGRVRKIQYNNIEVIEG